MEFVWQDAESFDKSLWKQPGASEAEQLISWMDSFREVEKLMHCCYCLQMFPSSTNSFISPHSSLNTEHKGETLLRDIYQFGSLEKKNIAA